MSQPGEHARRFLELHRRGEPLLLANAWDAGSARVLESLGYEALATTSSGHAGTLGRKDGSVTRDVALSHCSALVAATRLPVSGDLENCFADDAEGVAETIRLARETGLAGCSIEDYVGGASARIYPLAEAVGRVRAAVAAIRAVVESVDVPVNVLFRPGGPTVAELASVGVARISVGGGFYFAALAGLVNAAREWRERGTHGFWKDAIPGVKAAHEAFH